ncbi:MAG TPA: methyltransferase [Polyangia bacterium]|nr:methyltransferase [Polyangia bacterium]
MSSAEDARELEAESGAVTHDTLLRGRVKLIQPVHGFRSSLDPVLLAGFIQAPYGHFLDIGCGTGALAFLLLARDAAATGLGVEIQPRLAGLAIRSVQANGFGARFAVVASDVRDVGPVLPADFDLVASNPPFRPLGQGVLPPQAERSLAHHEVALTLAEWLDVAKAALRPEGRLAAIYPADRLDEMRAALTARGLTMSRLRMVQAQADARPSRFCFEARRSALVAETLNETPLVVHEQGKYSAEVRLMLGEES